LHNDYLDYIVVCPAHPACLRRARRRCERSVAISKYLAPQFIAGFLFSLAARGEGQSLFYITELIKNLSANLCGRFMIPLLLNS
jgi:hypothetical protein